MAESASAPVPPKAPGSADNGPAPTVKRNIKDLHKQPAAGRLFCDKSGDTYVLTDTVVCDQKRLPPGEWSLEFGVDGINALLVREGRDEDSDGEIINPSKYLTRGNLFKDSRGERIVALRGGSGDVFRQWSLDNQLTRYHDGEVTVRGRGMGLHGSIQTVLLTWRRECDTRLLRCAADFYELLGLDSHYKVPSKWVWQSASSWVTHVKKMFGHCPIVYSKHGNNLKRQKTLPWYDRCMPFTGLGTSGVMAQLCRWSFVHRERGGFGNVSCQTAARSFLHTVLKLVVPALNGGIMTKMDSDWTCMWPRPSSIGILNINIKY